MVQIKKIYDEAADTDGYRVLVDRLWPRGMSKDRAKLGIWLKEVGPSDGLRKYFAHDPAKYDEFKLRYTAELHENPAFEELKKIVQDHQIVTLLFSAHDSEHSQAAVLRELL